VISRARFATLQVGFGAIEKITGMDQQFAVLAGRDSNPSIGSDGRRHDETIVVVRMFSDQIDASRRTIDPWPSAKKLMKFVL
jgi:hypothetical protein